MAKGPRKCGAFLADGDGTYDMNVWSVLTNTHKPPAEYGPCCADVVDHGKRRYRTRVVVEELPDSRWVFSRRLWHQLGVLNNRFVYQPAIGMVSFKIYQPEILPALMLRCGKQLFNKSHENHDIHIYFHQKQNEELSVSGCITPYNILININPKITLPRFDFIR